MSEISEDVNPKSENKFSLKLKPFLDSSNNSQNEDEIYFSSNCLIMNQNYICKTNPSQISKKAKIFESIDSNIKKKLFSSEIVPKSDNKKSSEAISTELTSIKVKNYNSPKKKYSVFRLIEKEKKNKKEMRFAVKKYETEEKEELSDKIERRDIYGNIISKKNKKNVKVSFIDKVTTQPLVNVVDIECFKNYNYIYGIPKEEKIEKTVNCKCCLIF